MGHFSANSSSHTFLLEFLQFVVAVVGYSCHSTGFIDTVVKWNVDVALSHMTDSMHRKTPARIQHRDIHFYTVNTCTVIQFRTIYGYSLKVLWIVSESIRERNYRLKTLFIWVYLIY